MSEIDYSDPLGNLLPSTLVEADRAGDLNAIKAAIPAGFQSAECWIVVRGETLQHIGRIVLPIPTDTSQGGP